MEPDMKSTNNKSPLAPPPFSLADNTYTLALQAIQFAHMLDSSVITALPGGAMEYNLGS